MTVRGAIVPAVLPYHAIGSGAFAALGTLYQLSYFPTHDLSETVYRACGAKFAAENAPGVGQSTYALVIAPLSGLWTLVYRFTKTCSRENVCDTLGPWRASPSVRGWL